MEIIIILTFLAILFLFVGFFAGRGTHSFKDFILAKNIYGHFALTSTITASFVGGGFFIGTLEKCYQFGVAPAFALLGFSVQLIMTGYLICSKRDKFNDCSSVGEIVLKSFGHRAQIFVGLLWISFSIGIVTTQFSAMGSILSTFAEIDYFNCVLISAVLVTFYCLIGGVRAVVATDMIQFALFAGVLPIALAYAILDSSFEIESISVTSLTLGMTSGEWGWNALFSSFFGFLFGDALIAPVIQRILMARSASSAKSSFIRGGIITVPLCFVACGIGIYVSTVSPDLNTTSVLSYFLNESFSGWTRAIIIAAFAAVVISSADTYLNATASVLVNDIALPLKPKLNDKQLLSLSRIVTLIVGLIALTVALYVQNIFDLLLYTYKFWGPIVVLPLLCAFYGYELTSKEFFFVSGAGGITVILWNILDINNVSDLVAGFSAGFFTLVLIACIKHLVHIENLKLK